MDTMYYTVVRNKRNEFDVLQCDPPTARYCGKRIVATAKTHKEGIEIIKRTLKKNKEICQAIARHGAIGVGSKTITDRPKRRYAYRTY